MPRVVVTGSNRGLGLEWCRQYADAGWEVIATCRHPRHAGALNQLASEHPAVEIHGLDVTRADQIHRLHVELETRPVDLLINNAGVFLERWSQDPLGRIDYDDWAATLRVNTFGAVRLSEALIDCIAASGRRLIVAISSHMGSITDITEPNNYAYRTSKAALNAAMKGLAEEVRPRGVGVLLLHPGWVNTRMGGESGPYTPQQSVAGMRRLVERFDITQTGRFVKFDGEPMPW